jgi:hypothetical protein
MLGSGAFVAVTTTHVYDLLFIFIFHCEQTSDHRLHLLAEIVSFPPE